MTVPDQLAPETAGLASLGKGYAWVLQRELDILTQLKGRSDHLSLSCQGQCPVCCRWRWLTAELAARTPAK